MNIALSAEMKKYVHQQLDAAGYSSASEYIRDLIRRDQKQKEEARLEALLIEGLDSGEPFELTPEKWKELRDRTARKRKKRSRPA